MLHELGSLSLSQGSSIYPSVLWHSVYRISGLFDQNLGTDKRLPSFESPLCQIWVAKWTVDTHLDALEIFGRRNSVHLREIRDLRLRAVPLAKREQSLVQATRRAVVQ